MEDHVQNTKCIICEQDKPLGIRICSQFVCDDCESEMVSTEVSDARYPYFIHQMNKIWYRVDA